MKTVDIVVPCYNEEEVLNNFYEVTRSWCDKIPDYDFRFLFIDDGSRDKTVCIMRELAAAHPEVKYISFSRNFGKEPAMYAGLSNSTADYVIVMDADLQHPPSMFPDFIAGIEEGHDCVAAKRTNRKGESKIRSFLSRRFYKLSNRMSDVKLEYGAVDYRIMSRRMVDSILRLSEVQRFSKGIFAWVGYDTKWIPYENVE
ncbi:MAG: glycosyltransferase family 2 protein, partial [Lachnospiraceae bacterium]|nr:glycosyltransferase family 2 protein [Lachnospiraceae bacterium]